MPTQLISVGPPTVLTQNVVYALPARAVVVTSSLAVEVSMDGSTGWTALASGATTGASFIRSTVGSPIVTCKANSIL